MGNKRKQFVRNAADKERGAQFPLFDAFRCASRGLHHVISTQRNTKIQILIGLVAIILGFALSLPLSSWLAVIICITAVFAAECINTALESVVDLVSPGYAELAKRAKDCAAAGVLVCAIGSLVVACVVYGQAILAYF